VLIWRAVHSADYVLKPGEKCDGTWHLDGMVRTVFRMSWYLYRFLHSLTNASPASAIYYCDADPEIVDDLRRMCEEEGDDFLNIEYIRHEVSLTFSFPSKVAILTKLSHSTRISTSSFKQPMAGRTLSNVIYRTGSNLKTTKEMLSRCQLQASLLTSIWVLYPRPLMVLNLLHMALEKYCRFPIQVCSVLLSSLDMQIFRKHKVAGVSNGARKTAKSDEVPAKRKIVRNSV